MEKRTSQQKSIQNSLLEKIFVVVINLSMLIVIPYWYLFVVVPQFIVHWIVFITIILAFVYSIVRGVAVLRDKLEIRDYLNIGDLENKKSKSRK